MKIIRYCLQLLINNSIIKRNKKEGGHIMEPKKYDAVEIAKYMIDKSTREGHPISNLQLQKILYYVLGAFWKEKGYQVFDNEVQAWSYGPVIKDVYDMFCMYGGIPICDLYDDVSIEDDDKRIIDKVLAECRAMYVWDLVDKSHEKGTPWERVYKNYRVRIPSKYIREYFCKK